MCVRFETFEVGTGAGGLQKMKHVIISHDTLSRLQLSTQTKRARTTKHMFSVSGLASTLSRHVCC